MHRSSFRLIALVAACAACAACGQSTVSFMVVRPAILNIRAHGGTVTVQHFLPGMPDLAEVAGQLRAEVIAHVAGDVPGAVQLNEYGGGVVLTARVDDYRLTLFERSRSDTCSVDARQPDGSRKTVRQPCDKRWYDWTARMAVAAQVSAAAGKLLSSQVIVDQNSGSTAEVTDTAPVPPNGHNLLQVLRLRTAQKIASLVAPTKVRVDVTLYECEEPGKDACKTGIRLFAESKYDQAIAAFTHAIGALESSKADTDDVAEAYFDRAIVFQYSRRFDEALADLKRADMLDPSDGYKVQQAEVERERALHLQLVEQGLAPAGSPAAPPPPPPAARP